MAQSSTDAIRRAHEEQEEKVEAARREVEIAWTRLVKDQERIISEGGQGCGVSCRLAGGCEEPGQRIYAAQEVESDQYREQAHHSQTSRIYGVIPHDKTLPTTARKCIGPSLSPNYQYPTPSSLLQQSSPSSPHQTPPLSEKPPFDPECCSGLFDCNALSAIPPFPPEQVRSDFDILVDAATHVTTS